ncbi:unnamed protein product [Ilex paraguariensis]|uniref:Uncharacterized protein n=1 Tax=Ilex paraguariensis TaxID=185542 RepID=A0ABC8UBL8_9AQUA
MSPKKDTLKKLLEAWKEGDKEVPPCKLKCIRRGKGHKWMSRILKDPNSLRRKKPLTPKKLMIPYLLTWLRTLMFLRCISRKPQNPLAQQKLRSSLTISQSDFNDVSQGKVGNTVKGEYQGVVEVATCLSSLALTLHVLKKQQDDMDAKARSANEIVNRLKIQLNIVEASELTLKNQIKEIKSDLAIALKSVNKYKEEIEESYLDGYLDFKAQAKKQYPKKYYPDPDFDAFEPPSDDGDGSKKEKNDLSIVVGTCDLVAKKAETTNEAKKSVNYTAGIPYIYED